MFNKEEFERIYSLYPRKMGKKRGKERFKRQIKTPDDYKNFEKAVHNYIICTKNTEKQYMKHFSTFMLDWEDFIEVEEIDVVLDKAAIREVICGNKDYSELEEREQQWIQDHNGRIYLGSLSEYELKRILGE